MDGSEEDDEVYEDADEDGEGNREYPDTEMGDIGAGGDTGMKLLMETYFVLAVFNFDN